MTAAGSGLRPWPDHACGADDSATWWNGRACGRAQHRRRRLEPSPAGVQDVTFVFTPDRRGQWAVDDVYVDPYGKA